MRHKSTSAIGLFILSFVVLLFSVSIVQAQQDGFYELKGDASTSKESSKKDKTNDRKEFYNLVRELHPTSYIQNNGFVKVNHDESHTVRLVVKDAQSFNLLKQNNSRYKDVELLIINLKTIQDLNNKLDLTDSYFGNLKYVSISCYFKCTEQQIKEFINYDPNTRVFYKIENPS